MLPSSRRLWRSLITLTILCAVHAPVVARAQARALIHVTTVGADAKGVALQYPEGLACSETGDVVVADTSNARLVTYVLKDGALTGGTELKFAELGMPTRLQLDSKGNILSLDEKTRRIVKTGAGGVFAGFVTLQGVPAGRSPVFPTSFKLDRNDNVYVLDAAGRRVLIHDAAGVFVKQLPLPKQGVFTDLAVDGRGQLLVVEATEAMLYGAQRNGAAFTPASKPLKEYANFPTYVTTADRGRTILVDRHGGGLVVVGPDGAYQGRQLSLGWDEGSVYYPGQICVTAAGLTIVADRNNHRVQVFTTSR